MARYPKYLLETAVIDALGLQGQLVRSISINLAADNAPCVTVELDLLDEQAEEIARIVRSYEFIERGAAPQAIEWGGYPAVNTGGAS